MICADAYPGLRLMGFRSAAKMLTIQRSGYHAEAGAVHEDRERTSVSGPHGFHRLVYTEWGDATAPRTLICVHGLTRNGRDFDRLAAALSERYRVICPDVPGRGRSDWLPAADYTIAQYLADMTVLIARLGAVDVDWLGTSMGGLIGMQLAAAAQSPVRRLILNDIGPFIPKAALARIGDYVGKDPHFASLDELEAYLRKIHAPFGPMTDQDWRHLALQGYRRRENGGFGLAYDPAIGRAFSPTA